MLGALALAAPVGRQTFAGADDALRCTDQHPSCESWAKSGE